MKFALKILPRPEVLDTQGRAVEMSLKGNGHKLSSCRVGTYIVVDVDAETLEDGKTKAVAMAENGLYNPLVEVYELETL